MAKYTPEEAYNAALTYFDGNEWAAQFWTDNIALRDNDNNILELTPEYTHWRVAGQLGIEEEVFEDYPMHSDDIFKLLQNHRYIILHPATLAAMGNKFELNTICPSFAMNSKGCDSIGGLCTLEEELMQVMKRGGSVGYDISSIRPKGSSISSSARRAAGLPALVNSLANSVGEFGGETQRCFSVSHPDSEDLLNSARSYKSRWAIKLDDNFFKALQCEALYTQSFSRPMSNSVVRKEVLASSLWSKILHYVCGNASPTILFDTNLKRSLPQCYAYHGFDAAAVGPGSGVALARYESVACGALNLASYLVDGAIDFALLRKHASIAQRLLDNVVERNLHRISNFIGKIHQDPESTLLKATEVELWNKVIRKIATSRRTAISVVAFGDMLQKLGIEEHSEQATEIMVEIRKTIALGAYEETVKMAEYRGVFKHYDAEKEENIPFIQNLKEAEPELYEKMTKVGRRNMTCLSAANFIAPKATIYTPTEAAETMKWIDQPCVIDLLAPEDLSEEKASETLIEAWQKGLCACTIPTGEALEVASSRFSHRPRYISEEEHILKRPVELEADVVRFQNNKEKWIAFVGLINGRPYEIFTGLADDEEGIFCPKNINKGKIIKAIDDHGNKRYDFQFVNKRGYKTTIEGLSDKFNPEFWNYAKLISGVLRYGMPISQVVKLVSTLELDSESINTWKMGVERALKKYMPSDPNSPDQE